MPCRMVEVYHCYGGTCCFLHLGFIEHDDGCSKSSFEKLVCLYQSITSQKKDFVTMSAITSYSLIKFTLPNELTFFTISSSSSFSRGSWHCTARRMQSSTVSICVSSLAVYMYCRIDLNALGRTCRTYITLPQHVCYTLTYKSQFDMCLFSFTHRGFSSTKCLSDDTNHSSLNQSLTQVQTSGRR